MTKEAGKEEVLTVYASVTEMLGFDRVKLMCSDGRVRIEHVRGKMRRRHLVALNDTVLAWVWPFDQGQCDIDKKCVAEKVKELIAEGHLSEKSCADGGDCPRESRKTIIERVIEGKRGGEEERNRNSPDALPRGSDGEERDAAATAPRVWDELQNDIFVEKYDTRAARSIPKAAPSKRIEFPEAACEEGKVDIDAL